MWGRRYVRPVVVAVMVLLAVASVQSLVADAAQQQGKTATLTVHFRECELVPPDGDLYGACHDNPVSGAYVAVLSEDVPGKPVAAEGATDAEGNVTFDLYAGTYSLSGPDGGYLGANWELCSHDHGSGVAANYPVVLGTGGAATCDVYRVQGGYPDSVAIVPLLCPSADAPPSACEDVEGVTVRVEADGVEVEGNPATSAFNPQLGAAVAGALVPRGATLTLTEVGGLPDGYAPAPGYDPLTVTVADLEQRPSGGEGTTPFAYLINVPIQPEAPNEPAAPSEPTAPSTAAPDTSEVETERSGRPARLYTGDCDNLGDPVVGLSDVVAPTGPPVGDEAASPAELSASTVAVSLDEAIDGGYALAVFANDSDGAEVVACGELGGVDDDDGALVIGLREVEHSGFVGIAYLAYNAEDGSQTDVSVFLAEGLAAGVATPEA